MLYKNPLNKKIFLTIDFEDLYFDYKRSLKITRNIDFKEEALWESYKSISEKLESIKKDLKITFFCTGLLAKKFPDLIKKISRDGHEIACHYFYHDYANKDEINNFEKNINLALDSLSACALNNINGFRAPYFSLSPKDNFHFKILSKYFLYDSSLNIYEENDFRSLDIVTDNNLIFFPVINYSFMRYFRLRLGGTYFKFINKKIIDLIYNFNLSKNLLPIIYLHPYEFDYSKSFLVPYFELKKTTHNLQNYLRQYLWCSFNKNILDNLNEISNKYEFGGKLEEVVK
jgi:hypothetical protein